MGHIPAETVIAAVISEDQEKTSRHQHLWNDFISTIKYIASNPKYKEIKIQFFSEEESA